MGSTLQTSSQLPASRQGAPPCHSTLPVLTSPNTVHFPSRGGRGGGNPSPAPTPPPENAFLPGTLCPARCKRCGRRTIPRRGEHNHRPSRTRCTRGPGEGCAGRPLALPPRHTSRAPRGPQSTAFTAPPLLGHTHSLPRPGPLRPERSRFPASPSSALAQEAPPRPPPRNPQPPAPLTAAQRPAAAAGGGGRRPGARKGPDLGDLGWTPYLGRRRE